MRREEPGHEDYGLVVSDVDQGRSFERLVDLGRRVTGVTGLLVGAMPIPARGDRATYAPWSGVASSPHDDRVIMLRRSSAWLTLGSVLLVVAGGVLLWLPFHTQYALDDWQTELRASGVPAKAVVYDQVTKRGGNRTSASTTMYFRYEIAGGTYEQEVGCVKVCLSIGEEVPIWVNPADPSDFVTDFDELSGHRGRIQGGLGVAGFTILVLAVPMMLSRIPFQRWFPPRKPRRRSRARTRENARFTTRSKHKLGGRN